MLHRLAYLLYPGNETGIKAQQVIIFGPNHIFLNYIADVLPGLGVEKIRQTTFEDWALEQLRLQSYKLERSSAEAFFDGELAPESLAGLRRCARLKGSLTMAKVLRQYVDLQRQAVRLPAEGIEFTEVGPIQVTVKLANEEITKAFSIGQQAPLYTHRRRFLQLLQELLAQAYDYAVRHTGLEALVRPWDERVAQVERQIETVKRLAEGLPPLPATSPDLPVNGDVAENLRQGITGLEQVRDRLVLQRQESLDRARRIHSQALAEAERQKVLRPLGQRLEEEISRSWPEIAFPQDYYRLLGSAALLREAGAGLLDEKDIATLECRNPPPEGQVDFEDIPLLTYFNILLNGLPGVRYDHMVIDEAQDISPLKLKILWQHARQNSRQSARQKSVTIVGDLAQSIHAYRSISSWDEIRDVLDNAPSQYEELRYSYRSTFEITTFANRLLGRVPALGILPAIPFDRHGPAPVLSQQSDLTQLGGTLADTVRQCLGEGFITIAVICKTTRQCGKMAEALRRHGLPDLILLTSPDGNYHSGVVILPVYLAKGLEFDVAILPDAGAAAYTSSPDDARLLYVAATRPVHRLYVFWTGEVSPLLERDHMEDGQ